MGGLARHLDELVGLLHQNLQSFAERYPDLDGLIGDTGLPRDGWQVLIGMSGGVDSLALLLAARALLGAESIRAVHVDHGLQADSQQSAQEVVTLCERLGVSCTVIAVSVSGAGNLEQAAREARYQAFERAMRHSSSLLLLAHHQQDSAETVLMRLLRGRSAVDVPAVRSIDGGWLLRPLLSVDRALLDDVVEEAGEAPIQDPSNADERFDRNWLRHSIMPLIRQRIPNLNAILSGQGQRHRDSHELLANVLRTQSDQDLDGLGLPDSSQGRLLLVCSLQRFGPHSSTALRAWLHSADVHDFTDRQLKELCRQSMDGAQTGGLNGQAFSLRLWRQRIYLERNQCLFAETDPLWSQTPLELASGHLALAHGSLSWPLAGSFDAQQQEDAARLSGLQALPAGAFDGKVVLPGRFGSRSLSSVLADAEVPPWRRRAHPLILSAGALIAIAGVGPAHATSAQPSSVIFAPIWRPFVVAG